MLLLCRCLCVWMLDGAGCVSEPGGERRREGKVTALRLQQQEVSGGGCCLTNFEFLSDRDWASFLHQHVCVSLLLAVFYFDQFIFAGSFQVLLESKASNWSLTSHISSAFSVKAQKKSQIIRMWVIEFTVFHFSLAQPKSDVAAVVELIQMFVLVCIVLLINANVCM